jgi:GAF domain-containing protein
MHQEPREFGEDVLRLLRMLAAQLAPALMNMRLLAQAQRRAAEARALAELMRRGSAAFEPDEVFQLIAHYGCRLLGADFAGVALVDPDGRATSWCGVYGVCTQQWRDLTYSPSSYIAQRVFPAREPIISGDEDHPITPDSFPFLHGEGARRGLSVPLRMSDEPIGSLVSGWRFPVEVAGAHIDTAVALASFGAVLADQARQEHRLATVVESAPIVLSAMDPNG